MKPYKSFLFLLSVLLFTLGVYAILIPETVKKELSQISIGLWGYSQHSEHSDSRNTSEMFLAEIKKKDSVIAAINAYYHVNPEIFGFSDLRDVPFKPFLYDTNSDNPLKQIYNNLLKSQQDPQQLRILHYGDEQIKNDHITKTFRKLLQYAFGGNGNGMIPLFQNDYQGSLSIKLSDNWSVMSMSKNQRRGNYGLCNAYLYPPAINALIVARNIEKGTIEVNGIKNENDTKKELFLEALIHEDVWLEKDLRATALIEAARRSEQPLITPVKQKNSFGLQHCVWKLPNGTTGINISLSLLKNRNIYALSINSTAGIIVDNISMSGSTGNIFFKNNRRFLMDNYDLMNVRLVIYQFKHTPDFHQTILQQELGYLRITVPDVPIIVIGNSEIQRNIALENGCVYWDLQTQNDHELAGKMLYKAFVNDYKNFVIKEKGKQINEYAFIR
jgi:hypothetical protein